MHIYITIIMDCECLLNYLCLFTIRFLFFLLTNFISTVLAQNSNVKIGKTSTSVLDYWYLILGESKKA